MSTRYRLANETTRLGRVTEVHMGAAKGYKCPSCGFETDTSNCDECNAIVKWDDEVGGDAHCTGCKMAIYQTTCRECGDTFDLSHGR